MAAVKVVLPWSTCPIVPTLTCGLSLENNALPPGNGGAGVEWRILEQDRYRKQISVYAQLRAVWVKNEQFDEHENAYFLKN